MEVAGPIVEEVTGKVAVVTGASQGIGVAIARVLHDAGMAVALLARSEDKLVALAGDLGERALPVVCDVGDPDAVRTAFATIDEHFGRVDLLVNNAGIIGMSLLGDADDADVTSIVAANLLGPMWCSRAAIPLLDAAGGGDIVNISSRGGAGPALPVRVRRDQGRARDVHPHPRRRAATAGHPRELDPRRSHRVGTDAGQQHRRGQRHRGMGGARAARRPRHRRRSRAWPKQSSSSRRGPVPGASRPW